MNLETIKAIKKFDRKIKILKVIAVAYLLATIIITLI